MFKSRLSTAHIARLFSLCLISVQCFGEGRIDGSVPGSISASSILELSQKIDTLWLFIASAMVFFDASRVLLF